MDANVVLISEYEKVLSIYSLLRKECAESHGNNIVVLRSIAEECQVQIRDISAVETNPGCVPVLEVLKKSMEIICNSLANQPITNGNRGVDLDSKNMENSMEFDVKSDVGESLENLSCFNESDTNTAQQTSRKSAVENTIMRTCDVTLDDVIGLEGAKRLLREAIVVPSIFPQLFTGDRQPWRRILLYGPPGTGKSRLAMAVASQLKSTFYSVSSSDMLSCWFGESEKLIRDLFAHSKTQREPSVIFMDEIDGLCRRRSTDEQEATRRIKTELLLQMDDLGAGGTKKRQMYGEVIIICATNSPWEIDPAFLRRFQKRIYVPLPDKQSRIGILKLHCRKTETSISEDEWKLLGDMTDGFSGSDLATVANSALFEPVRDLENATHFLSTSEKHYRHCSADEPGAFKCILNEVPRFLVAARKLEFRDFEKSITTNKATVTVEDLESFEKFTSKFGQSGA